MLIGIYLDVRVRISRWSDDALKVRANGLGGFEFLELFRREIRIVIHTANAIFRLELDGQRVCRAVVANNVNLRRFDGIEGDNWILFICCHGHSLSCLNKLAGLLPGIAHTLNMRDEGIANPQPITFVVQHGCALTACRLKSYGAEEVRGKREAQAGANFSEC